MLDIFMYMGYSIIVNNYLNQAEGVAMKEQYEKPKIEEIDLEESFSFGQPSISPVMP